MFVSLKLTIFSIMVCDMSAGCSPLAGVGDRLSGGRGGTPGAHGCGGESGLGGDGGKRDGCEGLDSAVAYAKLSRYDLVLIDLHISAGDLFKYTVRNVTTQNSKSGVIQSVDCQYVTMSGGKQGPRGAPGAVPKKGLSAGEHGQDGCLSIRVLTTKGESPQVYPCRYDLVLSSVEEKKLSCLESRDGIPSLEFGETVIVPSIKVNNIGKMPTPSSRVKLSLSPASENIHIDAKSHLFLPPKACVQPLESCEANQGSLRYTTMKLNKEELGDDFAPLQRYAVKRFQAFQLGPEKVGGKRIPPLSKFSVEYPSFDAPNGTKVRLAYPVENRAGIVGLNVLGAGECTSIKFAIRNTSNQALGSNSESQRALHVQYYLSDVDSGNSVGLEGVKLLKCAIESKDKKKRVLCIDPNRQTEDGSKGHVVKLKHLPAGSERNLNHTVMFSGRAKPFRRATIQVDILLEDLPTLLPDLSVKKTGTMSIVQRRKLVVSCQPAFRSNPGTEVVLVTSSATSAMQYESWMAMLVGMLGLKVETYSLCVHGHLDPAKEVLLKAKSGRKSALLRSVLAGRLVVVLNEKFAPLPKESRHFKCRPSMLMARAKDYDPSTRWLLVGSDSPSVQHLSSLGSTIFLKGGRDDAQVSSSDATERTSDVTETESSSIVTIKSLTSGVMAHPKPLKPSTGVVTTTCTHSFMTRSLNPQYLPSEPSMSDVSPEKFASNPASELRKGKPTTQTKSGSATVLSSEPSSLGFSADTFVVDPNELRRAEDVTTGDASVATGTEASLTEMNQRVEPSVCNADWISKMAVQHDNIKSFKNWLLRTLNEEQRGGPGSNSQPGVSVATVKSKLVSPPKPSQQETVLSAHAASLKLWLQRQDPFRVYVIETHPAPRPFKVHDGVVSVWNFGTLIIHRGVYETDNKLTEVRATDATPSMQAAPIIQSTSMLYAVATSMDTSRKITSYCFAVKGTQPVSDWAINLAEVRQVLRDSLVTDFLLEASYLVESCDVVEPTTPDVLCTSTLQCLMTNSALRELMGEASSNDSLRAVLESELTDLVARLEAVADLGPTVSWWLPFVAVKPTPPSRRLQESLDRLKGAWTLFLNDAAIKRHRETIEASVVGLLKADPNRDRRGALSDLHSPRNTFQYTAPMQVRRHSEMDLRDSTTDKSSDRRSACYKSIPFTVDAKEVSKFESDYLEKQRFRERVRRSITETRAAYLVS